LDKGYTREELELREFADKLFLISDYRKAFEYYKSVASKM
jgi:hypothetical protein